jgi:hypothetical protein
MPTCLRPAPSRRHPVPPHSSSSPLTTPAAGTPPPHTALQPHPTQGTAPARRPGHICTQHTALGSPGPKPKTGGRDSHPPVSICSPRKFFPKHSGVTRGQPRLVRRCPRERRARGMVKLMKSKCHDCASRTVPLGTRLITGRRSAVTSAFLVEGTTPGDRSTRHPDCSSPISGRNLPLKSMIFIKLKRRGGNHREAIYDTENLFWGV